MCSYKTLAHNEHGYVILCQYCKHYQLAFGTTAVSFAPSDYVVFKQQLKYYSGIKKTEPENDLRKCITIDIFSHCSKMVLNFEEVVKLEELIAQAVFTEHMEGIFDDIKLLRK